MRILLTGGSGFVGAAATKVIAALSPDLIVPLRALNDTDVADFPGSEQPKIGDINGQTKWDDLLNAGLNLTNLSFLLLKMTQPPPQ